MKTVIASEAWPSASGNRIVYMRLLRASATVPALFFYLLRCRQDDDDFFEDRQHV
jgi:hypothetical protein